jgi:hypothetical protein
MSGAELHQGTKLMDWAGIADFFSLKDAVIMARGTSDLII